jgi:hypothetical protein
MGHRLMRLTLGPALLVAAAVAVCFLGPLAIGQGYTPHGSCAAHSWNTGYGSMTTPADCSRPGPSDISGLAIQGLNTISANAVQGFAVTSGMEVVRDNSHGGVALVLYDPSPATAKIVAQTGSNFTTTDPGPGGNAWYVGTSGFTNRYSSSTQIATGLYPSQ